MAVGRQLARRTSRCDGASSYGCNSTNSTARSSGLVSALERANTFKDAKRVAEWQDGRCYFRPESMALIDAVIEHEEVGPALLMAS